MSFAASSARRGSFSSAFSIVILSSGGTSLAILSTSASGMPSTRPTSRMTPLACSVPKVMIWATRSSPYFCRT